MTAPYLILRLYGPDCPRCERPVATAPDPARPVVANGVPACRCPQQPASAPKAGA